MFAYCGLAVQIQIHLAGKFGHVLLPFQHQQSFEGSRKGGGTPIHSFGSEFMVVVGKHFTCLLIVVSRLKSKST